jgi:hypothetical protein
MTMGGGLGTPLFYTMHHGHSPGGTARGISALV